jgi:sugar/nucleoside kinase (ribokinase family)
MGGVVGRVVVAGHVCLDLIPRIDALPSLRPGTLTQVGAMVLRPGGCVANAGGTLAALGDQVRLFADIGNDPLASALISLLGTANVDAGGLRRTESSTSYSVVIEAHGHDRTFWHHVGANASFDGLGVDLADADLLHLGYPSILPAMTRDAGAPIRRLLERAHAFGLSTSLDLAVIDQATPASHDWWRGFFDSTLPLVDVLTPSIDDVTSALGQPVDEEPRAISEVARRFVGMGAVIAVISAGATGMAMATASADRFASSFGPVANLGEKWFDRDIWLPVDAVTRPASTTGAGDAATAGLLHGILAGLEPVAALGLAADTAKRRILGLPIGPP